MTMARTILGEIFIAILVFSLVYAVVAVAIQPINLPGLQIPWFAGGENRVTERYTLTRGTNISQSVNLVELNVTVKFGAISLAFSNELDLAFDATFEHAAGTSQLETGYTEGADQLLRINVYGEAGGLNLTLGKGYQYGGTFGLRMGAMTLKLDQYTNISKFGVQMKYFGGVAVNIDAGASFEQLDLEVDVGGLQLNVDADRLGRSGVINTDVNMGGFIMGVQVDTGQIGVSLDATVDAGGLSLNSNTFSGEVTRTHCSIKTQGYSSAANKLDVVANVGLGGVSIQQGLQTIPGISV